MAAAVILAVGFAAVLAGAVVHWLDARLPVQGRRLIVNLEDGSAIRGILIRSRGPWLVLAESELLRPDGSGTVRVDGAVYVERPRVAFIQVLP